MLKFGPNQTKEIGQDTPSVAEKKKPVIAHGPKLQTSIVQTSFASSQVSAPVSCQGGWRGGDWEVMREVHEGGAVEGRGEVEREVSVHQYESL